MKIEDITKLQQLQAIWDDKKDANGDGINKYIKFEKEVGDYYQNRADQSAAFYQRNFLKLIRDKNMGVALYEMKQLNAGTPNVEETWEKLTLNSDGTTIGRTPCN